MLPRYVVSSHHQFSIDENVGPKSLCTPGLLYHSLSSQTANLGGGKRHPLSNVAATTNFTLPLLEPEHLEWLYAIYVIEACIVHLECQVAVCGTKQSSPFSV